MPIVLSLIVKNKSILLLYRHTLGRASIQECILPRFLIYSISLHSCLRHDMESSDQIQKMIKHSVGMWCANCRASKNLVDGWAQVILLINCDLCSVELLYYLIMVSSFIIDACSSVSKRIRMYVSRYSHGGGGGGRGAGAGALSKHAFSLICEPPCRISRVISLWNNRYCKFPIEETV